MEPSAKQKGILAANPTAVFDPKTGLVYVPITEEEAVCDLAGTILLEGLAEGRDVTGEEALRMARAGIKHLKGCCPCCKGA